MESPEHIKISRSAGIIERGSESLDRYIENLETDFKEEIERILEKEKQIGEGRAARVFNVHMERSNCLACVKIWRPELQALRNRNLIEYRKIQYQSPEEEFDFQDDLYCRGFKNIPRVLAYTKAGACDVIAMEQILGYTLGEIKAAGAKIKNPSWRGLERLLFHLNVNHRVVHRDIHDQNIMLKTRESLERDATLSGELFLIDFGLSKETSGDRPSLSDFELTIGGKTVRYPQDKIAAEALKPAAGNPESSTFMS